MSLALPYQQPPRLHAEPVTELCGFVACSNKHDAGKMQLPRRPSTKSLLHCTKSTSGSEAAPVALSSNSSSGGHERTLEMLRTALTASRLTLSDASGPGATQDDGRAKSAESQGPKMSVGLEAHRAAFLETLYEVQESVAESIAAINALMCNRVKLGLLDATSARKYYAQATGGEDDTLAMPIDPVDECDSGISSSLDSNGSSDTLTMDDADGEEQQQQPVQSTKSGLIEAWAANGFWRGVSTRAWSRYSQQERQWRRSSACSGSTLTAGVCDIGAENDTVADTIDQTPPADADIASSDEMGICWPLDDASRERTRSVGRFYADMGGLHAPSRYRTPNRSLVMLATEQHMMVNDKIVCPLKNRLQEPNPRRQQFEDYIRETGSLALAQSAYSNRPLSPLCNQLC